MGMSKAMRQMPEPSGRVGVARGEAVREPASDEACGPPHEHPGTGSARPKAGAGTLLEAALTRQNLQALSGGPFFVCAQHGRTLAGASPAVS